MRLYDLITEGISSVVYHATSFPVALAMLDTDKMKSPTGEISFTRSLTGSYHRANKLIGVIFEFDGNKINQKYKGRPVGTEDWDMDTDEINYRGKDNGQLEDRVYAKGGIDNISIYITRAIIYVPTENLQGAYADEFDRSYISDLKSIVPVINALTKQNIPITYVASERQLGKRNSSDIKGVQTILTNMYYSLDSATISYFKLQPVDDEDDFE